MLLKQKYLVAFLRAHSPEVFQEVRGAYCDTLSRVLSLHFRTYLAAVERLQVPPHPLPPSPACMMHRTHSLSQRLYVAWRSIHAQAAAPLHCHTPVHS